VLKDILPKLKKVKVVNGKTWACCPVHEDNNPSMTLTERDGKVLIHCFSCQASGLEVVNALGVSPNVLFENEGERRAIPQRVIEKAKEDLYFISIYENEKEKGGRITWNDQKRYKLAKERVKLLERD
jgi:hypothetical protein